MVQVDATEVLLFGFCGLGLSAGTSFSAYVPSNAHCYDMPTSVTGSDYYTDWHIDHQI